ncbi:polycystic kidney disease protein 1-like 2 [Schistocerca piceifrons]|uniref:polycystic kidney disease protein 1-like 2 n=1 Tax=Schistocerca piceifrons TaxID=274613 RepID=UPI001F5F82CF|nr:polycystic kidney disease protein 1-like 2 [Schistocerca piceifrons]
MSVNWNHDDTLEENIIMHRVEVKSGMALMLVFAPFSDSKCKIKVVIHLGKRPSAREFKKNFIVIPTHNYEEKSIILSQEVSTEDDLWFYIGIVPHEHMVKAFNGVSVMIDYSFSLYALRCQHWKDDIYEWSFNRCQIGHETTTTKMHCSCNHSSIFSGISFIPPNKIDAFYNLSLIIALYENPLVLVTVGLMFILFLITLLWARRRDVKDLMCRQIILLEDNLPDDKYFYLIMVHTGYKWDAGTSSNVGIQLIGHKYKSMVKKNFFLNLQYDVSH